MSAFESSARIFESRAREARSPMSVAFQRSKRWRVQLRLHRAAAYLEFSTFGADINPRFTYIPKFLTEKSSFDPYKKRHNKEFGRLHFG